MVCPMGSHCEMMMSPGIGAPSRMRVYAATVAVEASCERSTRPVSAAQVSTFSSRAPRRPASCTRITSVPGRAWRSPRTM